MFESRTGPALSDDEFNEAIIEAERRISTKIPPGYADTGKSEPYGDYLVWKQTLLEAAKKKMGYLVLVTSDTKDDWYLRIKGKTVCARPELAKELMDAASARLVMMSTSSFLFHAQKYLDVAVSPETIRQSKVIPSEDSSRSSSIEFRRQLLAEQDRLERELGDARSLIDTFTEVQRRYLEVGDDKSLNMASSIQVRRLQAEQRASRLEKAISEHRRVLLDDQPEASSDKIFSRNQMQYARAVITAITEAGYDLSPASCENFDYRISDNDGRALYISIRYAPSNDRRVKSNLIQILRDEANGAEAPIALITNMRLLVSTWRLVAETNDLYVITWDYKADGISALQRELRDIMMH